MNKIQKTYLIPIKDDAFKQEIRKWIGTHNGMSILRTEWCCVNYDVVVESYRLGISNPKTEILFLLSFPNARSLKHVDRDGYGDFLLEIP